MDFHHYFRIINKNTTTKYDLTPLTKHPAIFTQLVTDLLTPFPNNSFDLIASPENGGIAFGSAAAYHAHKGFIPLRKKGNLPTKTSAKRTLPYTDYTTKEKALEINKDPILQGKRILLIDDWIETGAALRTAIQLLTLEGAEVIGISVIGVENKKVLEQFSSLPTHALGIGPFTF